MEHLRIACGWCSMGLTLVLAQCQCRVLPCCAPDEPCHCQECGARSLEPTASHWSNVSAQDAPGNQGPAVRCRSILIRVPCTCSFECISAVCSQSRAGSQLTWHIQVFLALLAGACTLISLTAWLFTGPQREVLRGEAASSERPLTRLLSRTLFTMVSRGLTTNWSLLSPSLTRLGL